MGRTPLWKMPPRTARIRGRIEMVGIEGTRPVHDRFEFEGTKMNAPCQCCGETADLKCGPSRFGAETWACAECWEPSITRPDGDEAEAVADFIRSYRIAKARGEELSRPVLDTGDSDVASHQNKTGGQSTPPESDNG